MSERLAGLLLAALVPLSSLAQEAAPAAPVPPVAAASSAHRHLGLFVRPELGIGYFDARAGQGGIDLTIKKNGAGLFAIAIGAAVTENFIVAGQLWDVVASHPMVTMKGGGFDASARYEGQASLVGYGVLLNWYFQPTNLYVAVTPSLTRLVSVSGGQTSNTDLGLGVRGAFGKEWWVSDHWGIGLAASLTYSSNRDSGAGSPSWKTFAGDLGVSATYN